MREKTDYKTIQKRLLIPLFIILFTLITAYSVIIGTLQYKDNEKSGKMVIDMASNKLIRTIETQSQSLAAIQIVLQQNIQLLEAFKNHDRELLLTICNPIYKQLRDEFNVTHFYFHNSDRINFLRVHKPEKHGDIINRFTALEAEHTGKISSGIELGTLGTFVLRVVQPVYYDSKLIGYLELGKEIEDILLRIHKYLEVDLILSIDKQNLTKETWENGMKMLNRESNWNRFPEDVIVYSTKSSLQNYFQKYFINHEYRIHPEGIERKILDKIYRILETPLIDVSGKQVGHMVILQNITLIKKAQYLLIIFIILGSLVTIIILFIFLLKILKQTDQYVYRQQEYLQKSEERINGFINSATDSFVLFDEELNILQVNDIHLKMFHPKEDRKDIIGKNIKEIVPNIVQTGRLDEFIQVMKTNIPFTAEDIIPDKKFGKKYFSVRAFKMPNGLGIITRDITDSKLFEESLRKSENKYRLLSENISDVIWIYNISKNKFSYISSSVFTLRGYSPEEAMQQTL